MVAPPATRMTMELRSNQEGMVVMSHRPSFAPTERLTSESAPTGT